MPGENYVPPHTVALNELACRIEADPALAETVRAAILEYLQGPEPAALRALLRAIDAIESAES